MIRPRLTEQERSYAAAILHYALEHYSKARDAIRNLEQTYTGDLKNAEAVISQMVSDSTTEQLHNISLAARLREFRQFCGAVERE